MKPYTVIFFRNYEHEGELPASSYLQCCCALLAWKLRLGGRDAVICEIETGR